MKIAFGYPHGEITPQFHISCIGMLLQELNTPPDMRLLGSWFPQGGCYISVNRNKIATRFLNQPCTDDYLLMIDTDIEFDPIILYQFKELLENNPEAHIIAGRANIGNGFPVFYQKSEVGGFHEHCVQPFKGIKEFLRVGTGIILISRHALEEIKKISYTNFFTHLVVDAPVEAEGQSIVIPREVGDDFSFCQRAIAAGIKIWGAWDIFGQHYKPQPIQSRYPSEGTIIQ